MTFAPKKAYSIPADSIDDLTGADSIAKDIHPAAPSKRIEEASDSFYSFLLLGPSKDPSRPTTLISLGVIGISADLMVLGKELNKVFTSFSHLIQAKNS